MAYGGPPGQYEQWSERAQRAWQANIPAAFAEHKRLEATVGYETIDQLYWAELARTGDKEAAHAAKMEALAELKALQMQSGNFD